ncbi:MAG TPA: hypothetical protein VJA16_16565 [Thermoanaerobaculia bacterium]
MDAAPRFAEILEVLHRHQVDFILVGGVAAILEGAPVSTLDLDIVVRAAPEDRGRLLDALEEIHARYLDPGGRHIVPDAGKLATLRMHRLVTDHGLLDVLESIGDGLTYDDLAGETSRYELGAITVRVLNLAMIIRSKEAANRDKDRAVLPILRRTLRLKNAGS